MSCNRIFGRIYSNDYNLFCINLFTWLFWLKLNANKKVHASRAICFVLSAVNIFRTAKNWSRSSANALKRVNRSCANYMYEWFLFSWQFDRINDTLLEWKNRTLLWIFCEYSVVVLCTISCRSREQNNMTNGMCCTPIWWRYLLFSFIFFLIFFVPIRFTKWLRCIPCFCLVTEIRIFTHSSSKVSVNFYDDRRL